MNIALIVALSRDRVIGKGGDLPWRLPADLKRFKALTMGHPIVMGRKTWESIGRPLPGRLNVVITRNPEYAAEGATVVGSLADALSAAGAAPEVFVIGGAEIFKEALPITDRLHLTWVEGEIGGDVRFPEFDESQWRVTAREARPADEKNEHDMEFVDLERRHPKPEGGPI